MRRFDDAPVDDDLAAWLEAIDATLAGEPVPARYAESAELALLLADERPRPTEAFAERLDARVQRRFAPAEVSPGDSARSAGRRRLRNYLAAGGFAASLAAAAVVVVSGTGSTVRGRDLSAVSSSSAAGAATSSAGSSAHSGPSFGAPGPSAGPSGGGAAGAKSLQLPPNGRKVIQSAQLDLSAAPDRIDAVAQEVFSVVGTAGGIVDQSTVTETGGPDGHASFSLRLPSATVGQALNRLSELRDAQVLSRTDSSQDVNNQYASATRALSAARALRTALLKQLAGATTTAQIDSLNAQIHDADASIASDQASVNALNSRINYSQVGVTISARTAPAPIGHGGGGFTLGRASHLAARVLVVAAGVALVALAVLVPLGLVGALLAWIAAALRRRRREHALDTA